MEWLKTGELRIPPFQREIVWTGAQRLSLCDTIRRGLPAGSLMVWRTTLTMNTRGFRGPFELGEWRSLEGAQQQYLLDGLQRMTTLFAALGPALWTRNGQAVPWHPSDDNNPCAPDGTPWAIGFDVSIEEGAFEFLKERDSVRDGMLPLAVLLDDEAYDDWRNKHATDRAQKNRARSIRSAFFDYLIPVVPLATDDIEPVTLTFKRINTGGTAMGEFDMNRALSWSEGFDLESEIADRVMPRLESLGWGRLDRDVLLKVIATAYGLEPVEVKSEKLSERIRAEPDKIEIVTESLVWAICMLNELGFCGPATLPYTYILVFAARVWQLAEREPKPRLRKKLAKWLVEAAITERFSGGTPSHIITATWRELARTTGLEPGRTGHTGRRRTAPRPSGRINFGWARPVVTAAVMAQQSPRYASGKSMKNASIRLGEAGKDWFQRLLAPAEEREVSSELRVTAANRVVCAPRRVDELRSAIRDPNCDTPILASHAITPDAHAMLLAGDYRQFLERRFERIVQFENDWLQRHGSELRVKLR